MDSSRSSTGRTLTAGAKAPVSVGRVNHSRIVRGSQTIGPGTPLPSTAAMPRDGSETAEWGRWMKSLTRGGLALLLFQNGRGAGSVGGTVSARSAGKIGRAHV